MIIMSGVSRNADIILTADKKTFYPICKQVSRLDCALVYPELFEATEQFILKYYDEKVEEFLKPPPPKPKEPVEKVQPKIVNPTKEAPKKA